MRRYTKFTLINPPAGLVRVIKVWGWWHSLRHIVVTCGGTYIDFA